MVLGLIRTTNWSLGLVDCSQRRSEHFPEPALLQHEIKQTELVGTGSLDKFSDDPLL